MKWAHKIIQCEDGEVKAVCPEIISVSRSTDIPAFFPEWFVEQFQKGYVRWQNPFNQQVQYVSFEKTCAIVFCSKNPAPLMPYLDLFDRRGIAYYFQFTLNDYDRERFEPNVPPLAERVLTFRSLSRRLGKERVVWRFDPLILTDELTVEKLLEKVKRVGDQIHPYTEKLVTSFVDIAAYVKVQRNLARTGLNWKEFDQAGMIRMAEGLSKLNEPWGLTIATCGEKVDLSNYGIGPNKCIDEELLFRISVDGSPLREFLQSHGVGQGDVFPLTPRHKDSGQRADCGCFMCKDIGRYSTCNHLCVYCYANSSPAAVAANVARMDRDGDCI